jgi:hypothetical protein
MGGTMGSIANTYLLVPSTRAFDYGLGYGYAVLTLVPNMFWDVHPTIAHGTGSDWLVWTVDPYGAARRTGLGFSCVAEAYLNFGWLGAAGVMALVGFGFGRLGIAARLGDRGWLALVAAFTAFVLRFPRDESASLVRAFVWYSLMPYLGVYVLSRLWTSVRITRIRELSPMPAANAAPVMTTRGSESC